MTRSASPNRGDSGLPFLYRDTQCLAQIVMQDMGIVHIVIQPDIVPVSRPCRQDQLLSSLLDPGAALIHEVSV
jgi:hypothetical protein